VLIDYQNKNDELKKKLRDLKTQQTELDPNFSYAYAGGGGKYVRSLLFFSFFLL
jgi:hypothetical protein